MKQALVENRFTLTKELFNEGMKRVSKENYAPFAKKAVLGIAAVWVVMAVVTIVFNQSPVFLAVEAFVLLLACLWTAVYIPRHKRRRAFKDFSDRYGSDTERTVLFYEDKIVVNTAERELDFSYEDIEKTLSTERLIILLTKGKTGILVHKSGFTKGDEASIRELIDSVK